MASAGLRFMHPFVHIVFTLTAAVLLATADPMLMLVPGAVVAMALIAAGRPRLAVWGRTVRRLRYLLLSVLVLYGWFSPGVALLPSLGVWSPTGSGLGEAARRGLALVLMMGATVWLTGRHAPERLLGGLVGLLGPLGRVGFPHHRFAVRFMLTMELLAGVRERVATPLRGARRGRLGALADSAERAFLDAAAIADRAGDRAVTVTLPPRPAWWMWWPIGALLGAALMLRMTVETGPVA